MGLLIVVVRPLGFEPRIAYAPGMYPEPCLDDGPTDVALQEYKNKIINTLEEIITDLMNPIIK